MASKIWELAGEAAAVRLQLNAVNATDQALNPKAYYEDALSVLGADAKEVEIALKALQQPQHAVMLERSFFNLCKLIRDFRRTSAPKKIRAYISPEADTALARLNVSRESFAAAAAKRMGTDFPELFGTLARPGMAQEKTAKLEAELARLQAEIMVSWVASDFELVPSPRLADRKVCLVVRGTDGVVTLTADLAQHLTAYVERQNAAKAA